MRHAIRSLMAYNGDGPRIETRDKLREKMFAKQTNQGISLFPSMKLQSAVELIALIYQL